MKLRTGPKAFLISILALGLVGFGFWAGRGFPRTWQGVFRFPSSDQTVNRAQIEALDARVYALEKEVASLRMDVNASHSMPSAPETRQSPSATETEPDTTAPSIVP